MLLLAAVVVVASRWESISAEVRFSGLVASLLAVYFTAETLRHRVHLTATSLATLAAALTAPVGIAAASTLDQQWPVCVLVGGLAAMVATELQSRRWNVTTLKAATVVATGLAAAGLAALLNFPVSVIGAGCAVMFLLLGATKRSIAHSAAVGCTPALVALAQAGIGAGTLERLGSTGASLAWSAPLSAVIAAGVIAVQAHRRRELTLVAVAAATLAGGLLTGGISADLSTIIWWCVPGAALLLLETIAALSGSSIWAAAANKARPIVLWPTLLTGALAPFFTLGWAFADMNGVNGNEAWSIPLAVTATALWAAAVAMFRADHDDTSLTAVFWGASSASLATAMSLQPTTFGWAEVGTLTAVAVAMTVVSVAMSKVPMASSVRSSQWAHGSSLVFVTAGALSCAVLDLTATQASLGMLTIAVVLAGIGFLRTRFNPIDTAALATASVAAVIATGASPALLSITLTVLSAMVFLYSVAALREQFAVGAGFGFAASLTSLWWTSGTNVAVIGAIEPYGADGGDLALLVATGVMIGVGALVRRSQTVSSWLAYSPGLGMAAAWLLVTQLDDASAWATLLALSIGLAATAVGGFRRLGAPLLIGTAMIIATVMISAGSRLAAAPTWLWIAVGGIGLLVLAAVIERSDRPIIATSDSTRQSLLQQFCQDFD